ncbi:hypothetical protein [Verminephrobacter eiseniae]|uniref:Transmembrane protein n=1 Tax=Verminephrobacter eiseniae (strain EF01-2) TaxID=391735 RepID=A1WEH7_VEREI|nr:hypothetical protein [Verminephrobacter eiseniae]ABM56034.1 hypothetical protein Veis_0243 [Verminephrobacter eiseniae EF01-2]
MQHCPPAPRPPRPPRLRGTRASLCLALALTLGAAASAQAPWPEVALPAQARSYGIGQQLDMNGLPMRLTGFATETGPEQTTAWFRRTLGQPLVENRLGQQRILGRADGEHYITVQVEPGADGTGSRGMVALTQLRGVLQQQETIARWRRLLPAGTDITSHLRTWDNGKLDNHLVALNRHSEQLNAQRLTAALSEQGYEIEREFSPDADTAARLPAALAGGVILLFRGPGKQAMATITRDAQGQTSIVLLTSVQMESVR